MNNLHKYRAKCGLEVIYYQKKEFYKSYCGIGCKFGSSNLKYELNNQTFNIKDGVAHFIEHKLFQMPDNTDAYFVFDKFNAQANAYTTQDKTVYFFNTIESIYEPLKLLLEMYFTPYFTEEDVNKEKDIIISEINMTCDNIDFVKNYEILQHTYPNDDYSTYLTGSIESVKSITKDDLYTSYNSFYTPDNSVLTIVSSHNPNEVFNYIENCLSNLNFSNYKVNKLPIVNSKNTLKPKIMDFKVSQDEVNVILRLDKLTNENSLNIDKLMTIFDNLFSISNKYTNQLLKRKLFENDTFQADDDEDEADYYEETRNIKHQKRDGE
jgi:predicted Zn-dependent peptidase